jgi:hypothetical protein
MKSRDKCGTLNVATSPGPSTVRHESTFPVHYQKPRETFKAISLQGGNPEFQAFYPFLT